ncbi:hypothetical protein HY095_04190 [Candidatus Micrarchaeota archaeon]|nr:hypothetical protein [Candidatus Micrarchaeota archaeon]
MGGKTGGTPLERRLAQLERLEERLESTLEARLFEIKGVLYVTLLLVAILLALGLGVLIRAIG